MDTAKAFRVGGKPNLVTLHFHFTTQVSPASSNSLGVWWYVFATEVKKKTEHGLVRVSLLGHGKLIKGQNAAVEIQLVTVFMELLQAAPTQTSSVWVYHPQRRP